VIFSQTKLSSPIIKSNDINRTMILASQKMPPIGDELQIPYLYHAYLAREIPAIPLHGE
jgi:hypothetical protein